MREMTDDQRNFQIDKKNFEDLYRLFQNEKASYSQCINEKNWSKSEYHWEQCAFMIKNMRSCFRHSFDCDRNWHNQKSRLREELIEWVCDKHDRFPNLYKENFRKNQYSYFNY